MPCTKQEVRETVVGVLEAMNAIATEDERLPLSGSGSLEGLDSLSLVELVYRLQNAVVEQYGVAVAVAGESVLSSRESPFRSLDAIVDHLERLLEDELRTHEVSS